MKTIITDILQTKRATGITADDSQSGGRYHRISDPIQGQLPVTVMSLYIDLLAFDHSEVASDKRRCTSSIIAILAKALINTNGKLDFDFFHYENVSKLRVWSGFSRLHRPSDEKTGLERNHSYPVIPSAS